MLATVGVGEGVHDLSPHCSIFLFAVWSQVEDLPASAPDLSLFRSVCDIMPWCHTTQRTVFGPFFLPSYEREREHPIHS